MAVNADSVVVDVEARLTNLDRNLVEGERRIQRFASTVEQQSARVDRALGPTTGNSAADKMLGEIRASRAAAEETLARSRAAADGLDSVTAANDRAGRSFGRTAGAAAVAGVGMYVVSQNLSELEGGAGRAGRALNDLVSGNFIGFWKEARSEIGPTVEQLLKTNDAALLTRTATEAAAAGFDKLAASAAAAATALVSANAAAQTTAALGAVQARTGLAGDAADAARFGERTDRFGRGPGAVAESNSTQHGVVVDPLVGLSQRLQTALAAARASAGVKDDVAQLRRAAESLRGQLGQGDLTDADREQIYSSIAAINTEIKTLTATKKAPVGKEPPLVPFALDQNLARAGLTKTIDDDLAALRAIDTYLVKKIAVETDQNRKLQELQRLGQVRSQIAGFASTDTLVSDLFGGAFLGSAEFARAQSFGYQASGKDLLADLTAQVKDADRLATDLARIRQRGGSKELVASLAASGDTEKVSALAASSTGTFRQYGTQFGRRADQTQGMEKLAETINVYVNSRTEAEGVRKGLKQAGFSYQRGK